MKRKTRLRRIGGNPSCINTLMCLFAKLGTSLHFRWRYQSSSWNYYNYYWVCWVDQSFLYLLQVYCYPSFDSEQNLLARIFRIFCLLSELLLHLTSQTICFFFCTVIGQFVPVDLLFLRPAFQVQFECSDIGF